MRERMSARAAWRDPCRQIRNRYAQGRRSCGVSMLVLETENRSSGAWVYGRGWEFRVYRKLAGWLV